MNGGSRENDLLKFKADSYRFKEPNAYELKKLLESISDDQLKGIMICDEYGSCIDSVMFTKINNQGQKVILF